MRAPAGIRGDFATDLKTRSAYSEGAGPFRIVPGAVAAPRDIDDLMLLVRYARDGSHALTPRGAGSGMPGGNVGSGILVDLREFRRPLVISRDSTANIGAANTYSALDRAALVYGLRLAPNPSSGAFCTVGGMLATNAAGARSVRGGSVRQWVRGVEMVTADGEVAWFGRSLVRRKARAPMPGSVSRLASDTEVTRRFEAGVRAAIFAARSAIASRFPRTRKNSSGYALDRFLTSGDMLDLIIGSEGTLGFITRMDLVLEPRPVAAVTALLGLADLAALPDVVHGLLGHDPAAVEMLDRSFLAYAAPQLAFPVTGLEAVLLVEFERSELHAATAAVTSAVEQVGAHCVRVAIGISEEDRHALWAVRHAASPTLAALPHGRRSLQVVEDGCVPLRVLDRYIMGVRSAAERHGVEIVAFGHAGDGHLHVNALVDTTVPDFDRPLAAMLEEVTGLVAHLGGTMSGEHGDGRMRAPLLERIYGGEIIQLFRKVKQAFDPDGIMNPGVILPAGHAVPLGDLKVGARAAIIDPAVEVQLRRLETSAGWATPKTELVN